VAIARALLKSAPILALDEATSQLDYKTEASVKRYLRSRTAGRSTIVVAHRLSTIRDADKIIVLDGGIVREQGTHDELVQLGGLYASIWQLQNGEDESLSNLEVRIDRPRDH
jgi:ATP-binding cassette subfamily B protein